MNEFTGFEAAPKRIIWPALVAAADGLRLRRLFAEARRMMSTLRSPRASDKNAIQIVDVEWSDFSRAIEAEEDKRAVRDSAAGAGELGVSAQPAAAKVEYSRRGYVPAVGDIVNALGQQGAFEVIRIDAENRSVDLKLAEYEFCAYSVPWQVLELIRLGSASVARASSSPSQQSQEHLSPDASHADARHRLWEQLKR